MRTVSLLAGAALALALVSLSAPAAAEPDACVSPKGLGGCPGLVCVDANEDGRYGAGECVRSPVGCQFQSDCCDRLPGGGFWCPPPE